MSENKVVDVILHCQKQIKKERLPDEKLLHYLGRLARLRITVADLAETGIGRTVNSLSRNEGPVGQAAETLVRGWKQMVSEQQNQAERESEDDSDSNSGSSEDEEEEANNDEDEPYRIAEQQECPVEPYQNGRIDQVPPSENSLNVKEEIAGNDDDDDIEDPYMENGFLNMANVHTDEEEEEEEEGNDSDASDNLRIADDVQQQIRREHEDVKVNPFIKQEPQAEPPNLAIVEKVREHKSSQSKSSHHQSSSQKSSHHHLERNDKSHSSSSSSKDSTKDYKHLKESKEHRSSRHSDHHSDSKSRRHHSSKSHHEKERSRSKDKPRSKDSSSHREIKTEKDRSKEKKDPTDQSRSSNSNFNSQPHNKEKTGGTSAVSLKTSSPDRKKSESLHKDRKRKDPSNSSNSGSSSSSKKSKLVIKEEIDSTSGVNFSDVLGSLDVPSSSPSSSKPKKVKNEERDKSLDRHESRKKKHESPSRAGSSKHSRERESSTSSKKSGRDSEKHKSSNNKPVHPKIEAVIKPVVNISPNYKPINPLNPLIPSFSAPSSSNGGGGASTVTLSQAELSDLAHVDYWDNEEKDVGAMSQEDAISTMLSNRNARSKVFSGVKSTRRGAVPALFDLCMQVIKDNIGDLGYTGGIPYDILKPALERANPQQLMSIEAQNDHMIGETDELWQFHCKRDFRGMCPGETESWRELYERCKHGQQLKFELIKNRMKKQMDTAEPLRKTKLAYVDSTSGPRFNKEKAQTIKNGMKTLKIKEEKGPQRGVCSSASVGFNNPKISGDPTKVVLEEASVIISAESRAGHAPAPSVSRDYTAKVKPRKAPLMQKTMKLIRSLNRR